MMTANELIEVMREACLPLADGQQAKWMVTGSPVPMLCLCLEKRHVPMAATFLAALGVDLAKQVVADMRESLVKAPG